MPALRRKVHDVVTQASLPRVWCLRVPVVLALHNGRHGIEVSVMCIGIPEVCELHACVHVCPGEVPVLYVSVPIDSA